jgi:hypothetical protein
MSNPVGPEFNGPGAGVRSYLTPRISDLRWSTNKPTTPGWYFCRKSHPKGTGWEVRICKAWAPNPAEKFRAAWAPDAIYLMDDAFWATAQWSHMDIAEPMGG